MVHPGNRLPCRMKRPSGSGDICSFHSYRPGKHDVKYKRKAAVLLARTRLKPCLIEIWRAKLFCKSSKIPTEWKAIPASDAKANGFRCKIAQNIIWNRHV
jgi:hypothetical protein